MTKYLIENVGPVEEHITGADGEAVKLAPFQSVVTEVDEPTVKRLTSASNIRITKWKAGKDPAAGPSSDDLAALANPEAIEAAKVPKVVKSGVQATEKS